MVVVGRCEGACVCGRVHVVEVVGEEGVRRGEFLVAHASRRSPQPLCSPHPQPPAGRPSTPAVHACITQQSRRAPPPHPPCRAAINDSGVLNATAYGGRWGLRVAPPPEDHGTSHISVVDSGRMAVSMTTTVNSGFGAKLFSKSTGGLVGGWWRWGRVNGVGR